MRKLLLLFTLILFSCTPRDACTEIGLAYGCPYNSITNTNDLNQFAHAFINQAESYGIDVSRMRSNLHISFDDTPFTGTYGHAAHLCNDDKIGITINRRGWNTLADHHKLKLIYHEMGHDALNLGHTFGEHGNDWRYEVMGSVDWGNSHQVDDAINRMFSQYVSRQEGTAVWIRYGCWVPNN